MSKSQKVLFLLGILLLVNFPIQAQEGDLFNYENSAKFAQHLFEIRKYEASAQEYERVLFFRPNDSQIQRKLLASYFQAKKHKQGIERAQKMYPKVEMMPEQLAFGYGKLLLMDRSFPELNHLIFTNQQMLNGDKQVILIGQALFSENWQSAQDIYQKYSPQTDKLSVFQPLLVRTENLTRKKPLLALGLSGLVPGLGRFYTKQWKDGIISFVITGSLGFASYRNFSRNGRGSILGWVYGGLALGYYAGNLYGSFQSAHRFNEQESGRIIDETTRLLYRHF